MGRLTETGDEGETHPLCVYAQDSFDNRIPPEEREEFVACRPHEDAVWDWAWVSRNGGDLNDGWRFAYAYESYPDECHDAAGDMPIRRGPGGYPRECPDCGGRVYRLPRAWIVPRIAGRAALADTDQGQGRDA